MSHFGKTIKRLREAKGLSQPELGALIGVDKQSISNWEGKRSPSLRGWNYAKLAQSLGLTTIELDREWRVGSREQSIGDPVDRRIPVINRAPAGTVTDYQECSMADSGQGAWYVDRRGIEDPHAFAVIVTGDSMSPQLTNGTIAYFSPMDPDGHILFGREKVNEGHVVFVRFGVEAPQEGCTIARLFRKGSKIQLVKDNKKYKALLCDPTHIMAMAALRWADFIPGATKMYPAKETHSSKGENDKQKEGQVHPDGESPQVHPNYDVGDAP